MFNFFKHKKEIVDTSKTYVGRFITDQEILELTHPKNESFISVEMKEINDMVEKMKNFNK